MNKSRSKSQSSYSHIPPTPILGGLWIRLSFAVLLHDIIIFDVVLYTSLFALMQYLWSVKGKSTNPVCKVVAAPVAGQQRAAQGAYWFQSIYSTKLCQAVLILSKSNPACLGPEDLLMLGTGLILECWICYTQIIKKCTRNGPSSGTTDFTGVINCIVTAPENSGYGPGADCTMCCANPKQRDHPCPGNSQSNKGQYFKCSLLCNKYLMLIVKMHCWHNGFT